MKIAVAYCLHDDHAFLAQSIESFKRAGEIFAFVSQVAWHGDAGDWERTAEICGSAGANMFLGEWRSEDEHRRAAIDHLRHGGFSHALTPDGDEIIEPALLASLIKIAEDDLADRVYVELDTYWKSPEYVVRPREGFTPIILINLENAKHEHLRNFTGGRPLLLNGSYGIVHHLSYAGTDERIRRKISTFMHRDEGRRGLV